MKTVSFFAGVGGIDLAFDNAGFECIWANEIDKYAAMTYKANFDNKIVVGDIREIVPSEVPNSDVLLAGFPCQAFSVAGYRKGFNDERGNVFFDLMKIIEEKLPSVLFLENVKNLIGHDRGKTFRIILEALESNGYSVKHKVLNACDYGNIPQNRERIYIVAFRDEESFHNFEFPQPQIRKTLLKDVIDYSNKVEEKYFYSEDKCKFYDELKDNVVNPNTTYQWRRVYVRENKSDLCPTLTANMGTGGHNVPIIKSDYGIRKLTPRECFNIQGYPRNYILPNDMSNTQLYKQAGNSVAVPVVELIAKNILKAIKCKKNRSSFSKRAV